MNTAAIYSLVEPVLVGLIVLLAIWQLARHLAPGLFRRASQPGDSACSSCHDSCGTCATAPTDKPVALIRHPSGQDQA
ncbi:MAG: hypothetical protein QM776_11735 [Rhodocyclaceae bacterium]